MDKNLEIEMVNYKMAQGQVRWFGHNGLMSDERKTTQKTDREEMKQITQYEEIEICKTKGATKLPQRIMP